MSPRTGRPKQENAINNRFSICLDSETKKWLDEYSKEKGLSRSEVVRMALNLLRSK